jgi:predicted ATPase
VLVRGEAGIGKSRLIAEIRTRAEARHFTTLPSRCFEQNRSFPYAPFIDLLRTMLSGEPGSGLLAGSELARLQPEL